MNCGTHYFFKVRKKKRDAEELKPLGQDLLMYNVNATQCDTMIHPPHIRLRTASCRKVTIWPGPNKPIGFSNSSTWQCLSRTSFLGVCQVFMVHGCLLDTNYRTEVGGRYNSAVTCHSTLPVLVHYNNLWPLHATPPCYHPSSRLRTYPNSRIFRFWTHRWSWSQTGKATRPALSALAIPWWGQWYSAHHWLLPEQSHEIDIRPW